MPRRIGRALLVLLTGMAAALLTTACGDATAPSQDGTRAFSGHVTNYDGAAGTLRATARVFDGTFGSEVVIGQGTLDTDGRFDFAFEPSVDAQALVDFQAGDAFCAGPTVTGAAHGGSVLALPVRDDGDARLGRIGLASSVEAFAGALGHGPSQGRTLSRLYVDAPVSVEGACEERATTYDLRLDTGWNLVELDADGDVLRVRSVKATPTDAQWWFLPRANTLALTHATPRDSVLPWLR